MSKSFIILESAKVLHLCCRAIESAQMDHDEQIRQIIAGWRSSLSSKVHKTWWGKVIPGPELTDDYIRKYIFNSYDDMELRLAEDSNKKHLTMMGELIVAARAADFVHVSVTDLTTITYWSMKLGPESSSPYR